jgi:hypothetical protein
LLEVRAMPLGLFFMFSVLFAAALLVRYPTPVLRPVPVRGLQGLLALLLLDPAGAHALESPPQYQCLAAAYPGGVKHLLREPTGRFVVELHGGGALPWDDGASKTAEQRLDQPDLEDMFAQPYPLEPPGPPAPDYDPGRARVEAFFAQLYGRTAREVEANLDEIAWATSGRRVLFNRKHGAAAALRRVSAELGRLPAPLHRFFDITAGTFNPRSIAGTTRSSAHSWGIAIDLNVAHSDYWRWQKKGAAPAWRNQIPLEIVRVFERHGFIWGGRWHHFDTMHFEYRPELLHPRCTRAALPAKEPSR